MTASGFGHFGLDERRSLFRLREARVPVAEVASRLGRHRSTIYLELARNRFRDPDATRGRRRDMSGYYLTRRVDLELQFNGYTTMYGADPGTSSGDGPA